MLYPNSNSLTIKQFATIKNWTRKHSAAQKSLLTYVQTMDDMAYLSSWIPDAELHDLKNEHFGGS